MAHSLLFRRDSFHIDPVRNHFAITILAWLTEIKNLIATFHAYQIHHAVVVTVGGMFDKVEELAAPPFFPRPHLTDIRSPSISSPCAHASAARSADARSLKLTKAHLHSGQLMQMARKWRYTPRLCYVNHRLELP